MKNGVRKMDRRLVIILGIFLLGSGYILFDSLSDGNVEAEKKTASLIIGAPAKILNSLDIDDTEKDGETSNNVPSTPKLGKATGGPMGGGSMGGGSMGGEPSSPQGGNTAPAVPPASGAGGSNTGNSNTTNNPGTGSGTGSNTSSGNQTVVSKPVNLTKINDTTYTFEIEIVVV